MLHSILKTRSPQGKAFLLGVPGISLVDSKGIGKPMSDLKSDPVLKVPQFHP